MKVLLSVAAVLIFLLGVAWLTVPDIMLERWALEPDAAAMHMGRRYGVAFIGTATILWLARNASQSPALTGVLVGSMVVSIGLGVLTISGILAGTLGPFAWTAAVAEVLLAIGFTYQVMASLRRKSPATSS